MDKTGVKEEPSKDRVFELNNSATDNDPTTNVSFQPEHSTLCDKLNHLTMIDVTLPPCMCGF